MKEDERLVSLTRRVKALKVSISLDSIYDLILSGHSVYKGGLGLPHEAVRETIAKALEQKNMEYDTPEEMCLLRWNSAKNHIDRITKEIEVLQEKINNLREDNQKWEKEALTFAYARQILLEKNQTKQTSALRKDLEENAKFIEAE